MQPLMQPDLGQPKHVSPTRQRGPSSLAHRAQDKLRSPITADSAFAQNRWQRLAIAIWATILIVICIRGLLSARANSVYPIFAEAARNFLNGTDLYRATMEPYRYSPLVAVLFVPLSPLPDNIGGVLWRLLNVAVYLGSLAWW